ncbi:hypothetical protein FEM41_02025 [Jejubacter calystegiae]|uniref:Uncharacterized protein n=1 Tax=Jejubacter calystegiae TaxID=2579935 RepID=A0A4P8YJH4_9ENTR|nr:hypothetical protein [Jejubacter calystegiae]QCT18502.1 hypothetical protein FEM41_02025 [Jejubacter calystegiae]
MSVFSVSKSGLISDLRDWGVPDEYAAAFLGKMINRGNGVAVPPFFFNDTDHLTNNRHWVAACAAFWCRVYREATSEVDMARALGAISATYYTAGALGQGELSAMISHWWRITFDLHQLPAPSYTAPNTPSFH